LAPAGTTALDVTQAGWAMTAGTIEAVDINVPTRTANVSFILRLLPCATSLFSSSSKETMWGSWPAVKLRSRAQTKAEARR
jgi:hypothetical protein